jgi:Signal peptide peptidase
MADCLLVHAELGSLPPFVQDMMGICLVLSCLRGIRVNSLKVSPACCSTRPSAECDRLDNQPSKGCSSLPAASLSCQCAWQVATILLGSMLCYDVFWVFIQPRLSHSSSVMVEVRF